MSQSTARCGAADLHRNLCTEPLSHDGPHQTVVSGRVEAVWSQLRHDADIDVEQQTYENLLTGDPKVLYDLWQASERRVRRLEFELEMRGGCPTWPHR